MHLRDLEWLATLAELEHVTAAAAVLRTNQPTLSRSLARVEAELGVRIFERATDGVHPTPIGELVIAAARDLRARHQQLVADIEAALDPETGLVRLAFLDSMAGSLVPRLLRGFHEAAPRIRVELRQEPHREVVADLARGTADLAVTTRQPDSTHGWLPLLEERPVLAVPAGHRLAARRRVALSEITEESLIAIPPGFGYRGMVDDMFRSAGVTPVIGFESQDLATIEGLVGAGLGVAIIPEQLAGSSGTVGIPLAGAHVRRSIGLVWRTDREPSAPALRFRDYVADFSTA